MLRDYQTVTPVVVDDLCLSCGICKPSCHVNAIDIVNDQKRGMFIPFIDEQVCDLCDNAKVGRCVIVCPGVEVNFDKLSQKFLDGTNISPELGHYDKCYYSHAVDEKIRFGSSSGGLVTSLLIFALEQKLIDGAAVITMGEGLVPSGIIARSKKEVLAAAGSKYCPAHLGDALDEIRSTPGRYAVVGLPCHMHGIRKYEKIEPVLAERIIYHFGLYCANTNTFHGTQYFLKQNQISVSEINQLKYRGNGWPGQFSISMKNGKTKNIKRGTTETSKSRRAVFSSAFHYDFMLKRCFTCTDLTAELADIAFADPWNKRFTGSEKIGKSMLVTRTTEGSELLEKAASLGVIQLESADPDEVAISQNVDFKLGAQSRSRVFKYFGKAIPHHIGIEQEVRFKYMWRLVFHIMSFVPKNSLTLRFLPFFQFSRRVMFKLINLF